MVTKRKLREISQAGPQIAIKHKKRSNPTSLYQKLIKQINWAGVTLKSKTWASLSFTPLYPKLQINWNSRQILIMQLSCRCQNHSTNIFDEVLLQYRLRIWLCCLVEKFRSQNKKSVVTRNCAFSCLHGVQWSLDIHRPIVPSGDI